MSCRRPFCRITSLAGFAVAAIVLLTPAQSLPARAQAAQQAALSNGAKSDSVKSDSAKSESAKSDGAKSDSAKPAAPRTTGAAGVGNVAAVDQANPAQQKSLATKTIERVKEV